MDEALANALLVLGCPPRFRRVAPSRRRLEASRAGGPVQTQEPHHDPMTRADDPRQAVAAARPSDPGSLWHRRRWTGQVRRLGARPTQPGPDPLVPAPWTRRTPPGVEVLQPGGLGAMPPAMHCPHVGDSQPGHDRPRWEGAALFRLYDATSRQTHGVSAAQQKVIDAIRAGRTAQLGG